VYPGGSESPFTRALAALVGAGVDFVVVGVGGINFYAERIEDLVRTVDLDVLLDDRVDVLARALSALRRAGFTFEAGREPFVDVDDMEVLAQVVRGGATLAAHAGGASVDLMMSVTGFAFDELARDAERFRLGAVEVPVGRLEKLLRAKELAGRPKDREFLRLYAARLRDRVR
jgi:predicted nucleotidyltransferase